MLEIEKLRDIIKARMGGRIFPPSQYLKIKQAAVVREFSAVHSSFIYLV